jgi:hypothetical protein
VDDIDYYHDYATTLFAHCKFDIHSNVGQGYIIPVTSDPCGYPCWITISFKLFILIVSVYCMLYVYEAGDAVKRKIFILLSEWIFAKAEQSLWN